MSEDQRSESAITPRPASYLGVASVSSCRSPCVSDFWPLCDSTSVRDDSRKRQTLPDYRPNARLSSSQ